VVRISDELAQSKHEHSYFSVWDAGNWVALINGSTGWTTVDATVCTRPIEQALVLGLGGEVLCGGSGDAHEEVIGEGQDDCPENRGMMRGIQAIEGIAYAVGMQRQVYRRDGANLWTCIDQTARPAPDDENVYSFEGIDGFSGNDIYAAGRRGEIWAFDGRRWVQKDSPTNMILTRVCCAGDGNTYVCGRVGTLIRGRGDRWETIGLGATPDDFWGIAWYNDSLYVSTMRQVFRLDGNDLAPVDFGEDRPSSCFSLSAADGVLWSTGSKDIMAFDGKKWERID